MDKMYYNGVWMPFYVCNLQDVSKKRFNMTK